MCKGNLCCIQGQNNHLMLELNHRHVKLKASNEPKYLNKSPCEPQKHLEDTHTDNNNSTQMITVYQCVIT